MGTIMAMGTTTRMVTDLITLTQWLSPAFPVGAFSYSHGLERAVEAGTVSDAAGFADWLDGVLRHGGGRADATLLVCAMRAGPDALEDLDALARALAPSAERRMETVLQGEAFARTTADVWNTCAKGRAYPVAVGAAAAARGLDPVQVTALFLHGFAANLTSAAIRLVPLGQTEGQAVLAATAPLCAELADRMQEATEADLGSCSFAADVASMQHETMYSRLFRS